MNPALAVDGVEVCGERVFLTADAFSQDIMELAGRLCYHSVSNMGKASNFIADRVREGHEDILEHSWASVQMFVSEFGGSRLVMENRFVQESDSSRMDRASHRMPTIVSGNMRVWLDLFRRGRLLEALPVVRSLAPSVFAEFPGIMADASYPWLQTTIGVAPVVDGPMRVTLLGYSSPLLSDTDRPDLHGSAVFLIEGVSRALTHQLVRHRLGSFSQESQRYVDLAKGGWGVVEPPAIASNPAAHACFMDACADLELRYAQLRALGIRKEDARFLLPNATETRIIVSMPYAVWGHFGWLRAVDKAAQWEIRRLGGHILRALNEIAGGLFYPQMEKLESMRS